mgnify:CR=1 FL=1
MEQLTGVHRRNNVWEEQGLDPTTHKRELQRTSFGIRHRIVCTQDVVFKNA